ncbi:MAG: ankyrin repeat domain-containing protein [Chitinophagaceae bacterium]|nr:MAG: ankyrin repeat domain-containing protein [Chitinophagaceae bacterium]
MDKYRTLLNYIEIHDAAAINRFFENGNDPNERFNGVPLFNIMVEMYLRSPRFKDCVRAFRNHGLRFDDPVLLAILSDNASELKLLLNEDPNLIHKRYSSFNNAFTSLDGCTLLHYCAEYNHLACGELLIESGADVNARAGVDQFGFGGHPPIFHTVAQHNNNSVDMMQLLLEKGADVSYTVRGMIWGKGYQWETFVPAVNALSYAMMGLLPQMHRDPKQIAGNISKMLANAFGIAYELPNIPNKYLQR